MKEKSAKLDNLLMKYEKSVNKLTQILQEPFSEIVRDSAIKWFELAFDLSWKTIKSFIESEGIICNSPKSCFREAFGIGLLVYDEFWIEMVDIRNETAHSYDESNADKIYQTLPMTLERFTFLLTQLKAKNA